MQPSRTLRSNIRNIRRTSEGTLLAYLWLWTAGLRKDSRKTAKCCFQIRGTMPPEPRICFTKGLELCTGAELEELARAQPGATRNKHIRQICCKTKFRKLERLNSWLAEAIPTRRRSNDQGVRSTTKAGAVGHAFSQERR